MYIMFLATFVFVHTYFFLTELLGPNMEIRSPIIFLRPEFVRAMHKNEGFVVQRL